MKVLHLNLKRKWFEMVASGEKREEYRTWKPYWVRRFLKYGMNNAPATYAGSNDYWKEWDIVCFKNGYQKDSPVMEVVFEGIKFGIGKSEWGATEKCIVIKLGKVISIKNYK